MLIILCVLASLIYWYIVPEVLDGFLVFSGASLFRGFYWTVLTALFIHGDFTHLAGNMLFLFVFGNTLEEELGANKTMTAFFIGGVSSFIISIFFYGLDTVMLGASAAIFTLTAIVMLTKPLKFSWLFFMPLGLVAILYFLYNVIAVMYIEGGSIGYLAHVIGFLTGFPLGIIWSRRRWKRNILIAIVLLIAYLALMYFLCPIFETF